MTLIELSESLEKIKTFYMSLSRNAIFRYAKVVRAANGFSNRHAQSAEASCDASEAKELYDKLEQLETDIQAIKTALKENYDFSRARRREKKKSWCNSCGRKK